MILEFQPSVGMKESIEQRRAVRAFRSDPIPESILAEVLHLGLRAPSGYNLQPWRFILLQDPQSKATLRACAFDQRQVTEAPVVLICCGDRQVRQLDYIESVITLGQAAEAMNDGLADHMRSQIPTFFENQPSFDSIETWVNRHVMIAVTHLMLAAKSFGVDSCPMEGFVAAQVKSAFNIPESVDVCCLLPLGYATDPIKPYGGRFDLDQVCYKETYGQAFQF